MLNNLLVILENAHIGDNVCSDPNVMKAVRVIGVLLFIAKICVPFIIIVFGSIDFFKAVTGGSTESMVKQGKTFLFRVLIGVSVFILPTVINYVISSLKSGDYEDSNAQCASCLLDPFDSCDVPE